MIGAGLSQRGHTSYVPNTSMLGYRGSVALRRIRKSIAKEGMSDVFVLRANAKTDGSWRVCKKKCDQHQSRPAQYLKRKGGSRLATRKEETGGARRSPSQRLFPPTF
jgi:hypothetical protein